MTSVENSAYSPNNTDNSITAVTVYLSGAQITKRIKVEKEGRHKITVSDLPNSLNSQSIQVYSEDSGADNAGFVTIHSVDHSVKYQYNQAEKSDDSIDVDELESRLKTLDDEREQEYFLFKICDSEEEFLSLNTDFKSEKNGIDASALKEFADFYGKKLLEIHQKRFDINKKIRKIDEEINEINLILQNRRSESVIQVSEVDIDLTFEKNSDTDCFITLIYFVNEAGWNPLYDIRAKDVTGNISLHYKANVYQNTKENWKNVSLTLSTGNPSVNGDPPILSPWYIDFERPVTSSPAVRSNMFQAKMMAADVAEIMEESELSKEIYQPAPPAASVSKSLTSVEYTLNESCTVFSGVPQKNLEIITHSLPCEYHHFSVRKLDREVFLLASIHDWEKLSLIEGEASIFFEQKYVGKTTINPRLAQEKFDLSLGVDKSVIVTRVKGKDYTSKSLVGGNIKRSREWELNVRNTKSTPIKLTLMDQLPISLDKQIQVDPVEVSGGDLNTETGILTWNLELEPTESKSLSVKYLVTQPKNTVVHIDDN